MRAPFAAYQGTEPYAFVCYAHEDSEEVFSDLVWLREQGLHVWYDEGISPGANWRDDSARAIENASLFLYFISQNSVQSPHCMREVNFAADQNLNLLSVYLKPTALPRGLRLAILDRQAILKHRLSGADYQRVLLGAMHRIVTGIPASSPDSHAATSRGDRIHVGVASTGISEEALELVAGLTRYLSWQGGVYRSHNLGSANSVVPTGLIDYRVDVSVQERRGEVEASWQMSRADSGEIIWANRVTEAPHTFQTKLDGIAEMIGEGALKGIGDHEMRRISGRDLATLGYGRLLLKAEQLNYLDADAIAERFEVLKCAIEMEPHAGFAHASLAGLLSWQLINGASRDAVRDETILQEEARLALKYEPNDPFVLLSVGATYCRLGRYERGLTLLRRASNMAPTVQSKDQLARSLCFAGQPEEAIPLFKEILNTLPAGQTFPYVRLAVALTQTGRLEEAASVANDAVLHFPEDYFGWLVRANVLAQLARDAEALNSLREAKRLLPNLKLELVIDRTEATYARTDDQRRWISTGLRKLLQR